MTRRLPLGAATLATALLLSLTACGGDSDGSAGGSDSDGAPSQSSGASADTGGEEAPPAADAPAGGITFVDVTDPAVVVAIGPDGFEPADITVAVGDVVEFTAADDGLYSVLVHDLDGYTVGSGIDEYFRVDVAGTYPVKEDLSGVTATITAE
ncbi:hypothetical protein BH11ACT8_BH11ACT8_26340 [soil metagenome]